MIAGAADAGKFGTFVVTTLWVHGPWSPLLPTAYEPVLMLFGKLYPPWLIALTGATLSCLVEWFNYRVYDWASDLKRLEKYKEKASHGRWVALFRQHPFLVVWVFALSPLPDWVMRIVAVVAKYSVWRYVLAFWLGRLPKFFLLALLGKALPVSPLALTIGAVGVVVLGYAMGRMGKADKTDKADKADRTDKADRAGRKGVSP